MLRLTILLLTAVNTGYAQTGQAQPSRKDSVTVSAGFTKEELRLADEFDAKWGAARQLVRNDPKSAVKQLQELLSIIAKHTFLEHNRPQILVTLGNAYLAGGDAKAAVSVFEQRLHMEDEDCRPGAKYPSSCASAQLNLATAKMSAGESATALDLVRSAVDNFQLQIKLEEPHEANELQHFVDLRKLGEAELVYGIFLARGGRWAEAKRVLDECIATSGKIISNSDVQPSLRTDAQQFIDLAKKQEAALR